MTSRTAFRDPLKRVPLALALCASPAAAHEAWLLTPAEIEALATAPTPRLFADPILVGAAACVSLVVTCVALAAEKLLAPIEARLAAPLPSLIPTIGLAALRIGLAAMLLLAAFGGLPRHGLPPGRSQHCWSRICSLVSSRGTIG
jgi:hypothetical protein